jgi:hypothetical protein
MALRVLPGPRRQAAFEQDRVALVQVCGAGLGLVAEDHDVDNAGISLPAVVAAFEAAVHRQPQAGDGGAISAVAHLGGRVRRPSIQTAFSEAIRVSSSPPTTSAPDGVGSWSTG